jgi:hypothetical protein
MMDPDGAEEVARRIGDPYFKVLVLTGMAKAWLNA